VTSLLAAACGGDDDDTAGGETESTEESAAESTSESAAADVEDLEALEGTINISGSSTVEPVTIKAAELFEDVAPDVVVNVDGPGTGDGFKLFCAGETDISDASRAIKDEEAASCKAKGIEYVELKIAFDGLTVLTNPKNTAVQCLNFADLYALVGGESNGFKQWSDAAPLAKELGSGTTLPSAPLTISGPGTESGTYDSFIELALADIAEERGKDDAPIRTDYAGQAQDNVIIQGIAGSETSLGWVGFAFAEENQDKVKEVAVAGEAGSECVEPSVETIADGSYPLSRPLFIYVNKAKLASNPALGPFVDHYLGEAYEESVTKAFGETGYVALPAAELTATRDVWKAARG
jgi:phosphate transport system substrate-binding protein